VLLALLFVHIHIHMSHPVMRSAESDQVLRGMFSAVSELNDVMLLNPASLIAP
jgi:hypothetical protein